jgi:hypothetical protein
MRFVGSSMRITSPGKCKKNGSPFGGPPSLGRSRPKSSSAVRGPHCHAARPSRQVIRLQATFCSVLKAQQVQPAFLQGLSLLPCGGEFGKKTVRHNP